MSIPHVHVYSSDDKLSDELPEGEGQVGRERERERFSLHARLSRHTGKHEGVFAPGQPFQYLLTFFQVLSGIEEKLSRVLWTVALVKPHAVCSTIFLSINSGMVDYLVDSFDYPTHTSSCKSLTN